MLKEFRRIGRELARMNLISSHGGNMSVRMGERILITRRGCMLSQLGKDDLIEVDLMKEDSGVIMASSELIVHRAIYQETSALAVLHCHPPSAILLSLFVDEIIPLDSEGSYLLRRVPVLSWERTVGSEEVAKGVSAGLKDYKVVMVRGHGSFAIGEMLEEALMFSSALEVSSQIVILSRLLGEEVKEYRKKSEEYTKW